MLSSSPRRVGAVREGPRAARGEERERQVDGDGEEEVCCAEWLSTGSASLESSSITARELLGGNISARLAEEG